MVTTQRFLKENSHRLSGLDVGRGVEEDGPEDGLEGLEHLLALEARAQLYAEQAGQGGCRPLFLSLP